MKLFEDFGLSNQMSIAIKKLGFATPTLIQGESIPHIMAGKDVIGESASGSGKTLAFGCGIVEQVVPKGGLQALILTPTRELAEQVRDSINKFSYDKPLNILAIYGGVSINPQIDNLPGAEVVVATPGRLLDHIQRRTINTSKIKMLVLDEADRMLEMGFIEDVERIISVCPNKRQTLFFSATISPRIKELANRYMIKPIKVGERSYVDPNKLKQVYYDVTKDKKLSLLVHLLHQNSSGLVIVFCNTRRTTNFVLKNIRVNNIDAIAIHGGFSQSKRINAIRLFNDAKAGVLVCTDVASRGLHINHVSHVYNYELPKDANDYVHRIGRTARAGEDGKAINLLCDSDHDNFSRILSEHSIFSIEKVKTPFLERIMIARNDKFRRHPERQPFNRRKRARRW